MYRKLTQCVAGAALGVAALAASAGNLTIESWRDGDKPLWDQVLIPAFEKKHPDIKVTFSPTTPMAEYDNAVSTRLDRGNAGDLITCRPFDVSLRLYERGHLERLNNAKGMANFPLSTRVAWQTDDGRYVFCLPMASVIHGFFYNKKVFSELGVAPPKTADEFFRVLEAVKKSGKYTPLALGTADKWESHEIVYTGIGPNYWRGETGRQILVLRKVLQSQGKKGVKRFTDPEFVAVWDQMSKWGPYMGQGYSTRTYVDSQKLFASGKAAIYPAGSWDISTFKNNAAFEFGAFPPPLPYTGAKCFISDHLDIGMGVNSKSKNKAEAYKFLAWLASAEFAQLYTNHVTGFFSLSKHAIDVKDPVAKEMIGWRRNCASTIRLPAQILNRGQPSLSEAFWEVDSRVLNGQLSPGEAAQRIEAVFSKN